MIRPSDIHTLTEFKRRSTEFLEHLRASGRPQVLTIEGRPQVVLLGVEAYERMAELASRAEVVEGIRLGLEDVDAERVLPLSEFEAALRNRLGLEPED